MSYGKRLLLFLAIMGGAAAVLGGLFLLNAGKHLEKARVDAPSVVPQEAKDQMQQFFNQEN